MANKPTRVVVVDDNIIYRRGICGIIQAQPDMQVIAEAEDGQAAIEAVDELRPDVVLMDYSMPVLDGIEATRVISTKFPDVRVIILTIYDETPVIENARKAGAVDCICKDCSAQEIIQAIMVAGT